MPRRTNAAVVGVGAVEVKREATSTGLLLRALDFALATRHTCVVHARRTDASTCFSVFATGQVSVERVSVAKMKVSTKCGSLRMDHRDGQTVVCRWFCSIHISSDPTLQSGCSPRDAAGVQALRMSCRICNI